ncbi:MAG: M20/M25/M40 family metallo-hydrolase, partial [Acidobacteriota bacterium]|nr:M20/M25/M40 family metallo-hydrolase [Acidobacteriota bacterium]
PMELRRDALTAAAEWTLHVESEAKKSHRLVATVGMFEVTPSAGNVIPGQVRASLDVRHRQDATRQDAVRRLLQIANEICAARGIDLRYDERLDQPAVVMTLDLGRPDLHHMTSGAGHDAMILAPHMPTGMVFVRSPGGISHHPDESVLEEDVDAALELGREICMTL